VSVRQDENAIFFSSLACWNRSVRVRLICFAVLSAFVSCCFEFLWVGARALRERDMMLKHDAE
jgi:hypothetical protein